MKGVKRVLQITGCMNRGGAETMIMNIYREIDKSKIQFDFLSFSNEKCDYDEEITSLGGRIYILENSSNPLKRIIELYRFLTENKKKYQAIHSHTLFNSGINVLLAAWLGYRKRIVHSHSTNDSSGGSYIGRVYHQLSKTLIKRFGTDYVACGIDAGKYLFSFNQNKVIQLPNAIDVNYFNKCSVDNKGFIHKELGLETEVIIITQIGRLISLKNHNFSIQIAEKLKSEGINFHMVFAGDGELQDVLKRKCIERGVNEDISFLGKRTDIPSILADTDILLMPSIFEGFPVTLVESQASGVMALVSNNVSSEVDLGVDLVSFLSLKSTDKWVDSIINKPLSRDKQHIVNILTNKGFDIKSITHRIEKLYLY